MKTAKLPKIIAVVGPTSSGKSDVAVLIAKKVDGEVVSADSRQVYKGMNIGTGKVTKKEMAGITHHLLDVSNPKKVFTVAEYQKLAKKAIDKILAKNKIPIICGGTGFYIRGVIDDLEIPDVPPNKKLRKELKNKSVEELFSILKKLDIRRAEEIDRHNPVRLIRAIEIAKALGKVPPLKNKESKYDLLEIGLNPGQKVLNERIKNRLLRRIKAGMFREIKNLHEDGVSWTRMEDMGLEYRYVSRYLQGLLKKEEMILELNKEIERYAKRQMTWFNKDKRVRWFKPDQTEKILKIAERFVKAK
ncbi:MAG: tRNA dimethylallyltransferase [Parcubacteria group bacterium GW2011_GWF2_38_76]|nr:MAG: tRNA dimethylallyltransferase [Parcubacteria group bacterium GW2011_GWF2_38_76]HBM45487.1 tRNA (adenosine(37)-N6)-dimethylallyltransferase MiaA [Patescibacteria group bacterium]